MPTFAIALLEDCMSELHTCRRDKSVYSHFTLDTGALVTMQVVARHNLGVCLPWNLQLQCQVSPTPVQGHGQPSLKGTSCGGLSGPDQKFLPPHYVGTPLLLATGSCAYICAWLQQCLLARSCHHDEGFGMLNVNAGTY